MGLDYGKGTTDGGENKSTAAEDNKPIEKDITSGEDKTKAAAATSTTEGVQETEEAKKIREAKEGEGESNDEPGGLNKFYDENPDKKALSGKGEFKIKDGDYEEDDGKIIIRAKHLHDDIIGIIDDPNKFFKIKKANPEKAKLFTKWMGMKRSDGSPDVDRMASVLNEFLIAKTPEDERQIIDDNFPEWLATREFPFTFEEKAAAPGEKEVSKDIPYRYDELESAVGSLVNSYKGEKTDGQPEITAKEVWNDAKFFDALKANKFNPGSGKKRTPKELVKLAFEQAFNTTATKKAVTQGDRGGVQKVENGTKKGSKKKGPGGWY